MEFLAECCTTLDKLLTFSELNSYSLILNSQINLDVVIVSFRGDRKSRPCQLF